MGEKETTEAIKTVTVGEMMKTCCYDSFLMELIMRDVGYRIREERIKRNLSCMELAHLSNVSTAHINRIENGQRRVGLEPLIKICTALSIQIADMLPIEQTPHFITNGERFERITKKCSIKTINQLLEIAEYMAKLDRKSNPAKR